MGSLIYDYCRISASGSGGDQIDILHATTTSTSTTTSILSREGR